VTEKDNDWFDYYLENNQDYIEDCIEEQRQLEEERQELDSYLESTPPSG